MVRLVKAAAWRLGRAAGGLHHVTGVSPSVVVGLGATTEDGEAAEAEQRQ